MIIAERFTVPDDCPDFCPDKPLYMENDTLCRLCPIQRCVHGTMMPDIYPVGMAEIFTEWFNAQCATKIRKPEVVE